VSDSERIDLALIAVPESGTPRMGGYVRPGAPPYAGVRRLRPVLLLALSVLLVAAALGANGVSDGGVLHRAVSDGSSSVSEGSTTPDSTNSSSVVGVVATATTGFLPTSLAYDSANGWVYSADQGSDELTVINGTAVTANVPAGTGCSGVAYDASTESVYATNLAADSVSVINGTTLVTTIPVGSAPVSPVYDPSDGLVYVLDSASNSVSILNATSVVANVSVGQGPINAAYDPANGYVYVTSQESGFETVFSGKAVVATIYLGLTLAFDTVYDPYNGFVYVINSTEEGGRFGGGVGTAYADVIHGLTFVSSIEIGGGPQFGAVAAVDIADGWLYIPNAATDQVTIVSGSTVIDSPLIGGLPTDALFDPANGLIYVTDQGSYAVSVLNGSTLIAEPGVGIYPESMVANPVDGRVYVANFGESTISVLGMVRGWPVQFEETGLAAGTGWTVTCEGVTHSASSPSIFFSEPNGSSVYSVSPVAGYVLNTSATGIALVTEAGTTVPVVFVAITPPPPPPAPFPVVPVAAGLVVAVVAGVVVWAALAFRRGRKGRIDSL
jgi:YVTN family beta-propeller protein